MKLPNLFLTKKNWKVDRNQDNKYFYKTASGFNKRPSKSKSSTENENEKTNSISENTTEQDLRQKIEELNNEMNEKENLFTYNQKIFKKKLEEKDKRIKELEKLLDEEKLKREQNEEKIKYQLNSKFIDSIKELNKKAELNEKKVEELTEKNEKSKIKKEEYKKQIKTLTNQLNHLNQKVTSMFVGNDNQNLDEEIRGFIKDLNEKVVTQENEISNLNQELEYVTIENKKLKTITRKIIEQRNETEIFFLDALDDVKKELYFQKKEDAKRGHFFPTLKKNYEGNNMRVDIRSFSPEMREKILRNLFEKINEGHDPSNYKELNNIMSMDINEGE